MKLRPLYDQIIVKRMDQETKTSSGIVIPDAAAEKPDQGEVLAIGDGRMMQDGNLRPLIVKVGDQVIFKKYASQTIKVDGQEYLVLNETDVVAIVQK